MMTFDHVARAITRLNELEASIPNALEKLSRQQELAKVCAPEDRHAYALGVSACAELVESLKKARDEQRADLESCKELLATI